MNDGAATGSPPAVGFSEALRFKLAVLAVCTGLGFKLALLGLLPTP